MFREDFVVYCRMDQAIDRFIQFLLVAIRPIRAIVIISSFKQLIRVTIILLSVCWLQICMFFSMTKYSTYRYLLGPISAFGYAIDCEELVKRAAENQVKIKCSTVLGQGDWSESSFRTLPFSSDVS